MDSSEVSSHRIPYCQPFYLVLWWMKQSLDEKNSKRCLWDSRNTVIKFTTVRLEDLICESQAEFRTFTKPSSYFSIPRDHSRFSSLWNKVKFVDRDHFSSHKPDQRGEMHRNSLIIIIICDNGIEITVEGGGYKNRILREEFTRIEMHRSWEL